MTAKEREVLDSLREELRRRLTEAGPRMTKKHVLDALEIPASTFNASFRRGSVKVTTIVRILEHLDIDPGEFFSAALLPDVTKLLGKPEGEPPLAVLLGRKRLEKEGWP